MISLQVRVTPKSTDSSFPIDLLQLKKFKSLMNGQFRQLEFTQRSSTLPYEHSDNIMVKIRSHLKKLSINVAAESLNNHLIKYFQNKMNFLVKTFSNQTRKRRLVPHQTDVDKNFNRFTEIKSTIYLDTS